MVAMRHFQAFPPTCVCTLCTPQVCHVPTQTKLATWSDDFTIRTSQPGYRSPSGVRPECRFALPQNMALDMEITERVNVKPSLSRASVVRYGRRNSPKTSIGMVTIVTLGLSPVRPMPMRSLGKISIICKSAFFYVDAWRMVRGWR